MLLSCFSCPVVESSFSIMDNVMDETTNRLNTKSLSTIQTIKYWLPAKNQSAIKTFQKEDYMHEAVDSKLVKNMNEAAKAMKEVNQEELNKKNVSMTSLGITHPPVISKKKSLKRLIEESEKDRKNHVKRAKSDKYMRTLKHCIYINSIETLPIIM